MDAWCTEGRTCWTPTEASEALRRAWAHERGDHLQGVHSEYLDGRVEPELLTYLRGVATEGVEVRHEGPTTRVRAKPHQSAAQHQEEARRKIWEDVTKGRAWAAPSSHLGLAGIMESPQGRVPKMRPDRTLADDGRFINDMREANRGCDKFNHPPAKLPTHREIARTILRRRCKCPKVRIYLAKGVFQAPVGGTAGPAHHGGQPTGHGGGGARSSI